MADNGRGVMEAFERLPRRRYSVLVPNMKGPGGQGRLLTRTPDEIVVFGAPARPLAKRNITRSIAESIRALSSRSWRRTHKVGIKVRAPSRAQLDVPTRVLRWRPYEVERRSCS